MTWNHALAVVGKESRAASCVHEPVMCFDGAGFATRDDAVIQEVELDVVVNGVRRHRMTCSPWDVRELVVGNLFLSGVIERREQLIGVEVNTASGFVSVETAKKGHAGTAREHVRVEPVRDGGVVLSGLFGDGRPDGAAPSCRLFAPVTSRLKVSADQVNERIALLEDRSLLFHRTGGVHSAVLADDCGVVAWFEDIGRHSALDKLAGWCFLYDLDVSDKVLLFSGRVPREIIVKVIRLGCPVVVSPGAPTSLSVQLARRWGVTLVGFAKKGTFNVYAHEERVVSGSLR